MSLERCDNTGSGRAGVGSSVPRLLESRDGRREVMKLGLDGELDSVMTDSVLGYGESRALLVQ